MSDDLPRGWESVALEDMADILDSKRIPVNADERSRRVGQVPYYGATGQVGWIDDYLFDEELVLLGEDGAPFLNPTKPKAYLIRGKSWVNNHAHVLRAKSGVSNAFLMYQLNQVDYRPFVSGTTRLKLPQAPMRRMPLVLASLPEQRRIVAAIETQLTRLEAATAALERARANLKRYRAAVLKSACEGRLVPTEAELARQEGREYETAEKLVERLGLNGTVAETFDRTPEGWTWTSLGRIGQLKGGVTKGQKRRPGEALRAVPYLRVANVQRGYLDLNEVKTIEATPAEIVELRLVRGDILFNEGGDRDKLGRGWIWNDELPECIHQNHVFRARLRSLEIQPKYVSWYGNSFGQQYFSDEGKQTTNLASINLTKLSAFPIPLPPAAEQRRIVAEVERRLSVVERMEGEIAAGLARAARLRQAILRRAFSGKLVPQDPADEPASALLDRICAERAAAPAKPARGRRAGAKAATLPLFDP